MKPPPLPELKGVVYHIEEMFCHLGVRSYYSLLEGLSSPGDLVAAAAAAGMPALGLADSPLITGAVEFWLAARKAGVRPLLALAVDVKTENGRQCVQVLAAGEDGWRMLCRLSSLLMLKGDGTEQCLDEEELYTHARDLAAISLGNCTDLRFLSAMRESFGDRLYAGLQISLPADTPLAERGFEAARRVGLPVVAIHPVYYVHPNQADLQRVVSAMRMLTPVVKLPPEQAAPPAAHFLSTPEMQTRYGRFTGAMERTLEVAQRCFVELPVGSAHYPVLDLPDGLDAAHYLRKKAEEGANRLYGRLTPEIQKRLDYELEVIAGRGYEPIFLIVKDLLDFAHRSGIPTASRGSASSSLVAHCLGITTPDPLALDLYFERFLNPARSKPPDIDTDVCSRGRDRVIEYAFKRFGEEKVAMVATINHYRPKSALQDIGKAHGLETDLLRELSAMLPHSFWARFDGAETEGNGQSPFEELRKAHPRLTGILNEAESLLKLPRHLSVHPGGLVVAPGAITDHVGVMRSGSKGVLITQMDLEAVESLGLVKIDLLGIRGLTVMGDVAGAIQSWRRSEFSHRLEVLESIPEVDEPTADCVEHGQTIGCFQIESPGMRSVLREIRARSPQDILAALALYRPGPLQGGLKDAFVRRFKGQEAVRHIHPSLEPLLADTYGVILYQEQVLRIANQLAGFDLAEADLLRRAMSHFDPGKQMQELRAKFLAGAEKRSGVPRDVGEQIWELMAAFAGYGFPKAHAASYAVVGWRSAWCKTHFPAEFMAAVLANWGGYYSQRVYLSEVRRLGLRVQPPSVNHARRQFFAAYPEGDPILYMGLDQVRDLGRRTQDAILNLRPFCSLDDFLTRVNPRRGEVENLISAGALREFGCGPALLARIGSGGWKAGQPGLFDGFTAECNDEDWSLEERCRRQVQVLGTAVDAHPLELVSEQVRRSGAISTSAASERVGERVRVAGVRMTSHRSRTAQGGTMMFLTLEDLDGVLEIVIFPDVYRRYRAVLSTTAPILVDGVVEIEPERGEPFMRVEWAGILSIRHGSA
jgi:DNA-directed DNA polymerase III PolC